MGFTPGQVLGGIQASLGAASLGQVDDAGVAWFLQTLEGWDSAEVRTQITQREADHGAWQGPVYLGERPITITGTITAGDQSSLDVAIERLLAAVSLTDTVLVVYESIPKQCVVRRSGKPLITRVTDRIATYSVMVTAGDPRRYGTTQLSGAAMLPSSSGGLSVPATMPLTVAAAVTTSSFAAANDGTFATRPVFTITGPVDTPKIVVDDGSGAEPAMLTYSAALASGDALVIDCDAHTVILNNDVSRRRYLSATVWPEIAAGASVQIQFRAAAYSASATLTAEWRPAWI